MTLLKKSRGNTAKGFGAMFSLMSSLVWVGEVSLNMDCSGCKVCLVMLTPNLSGFPAHMSATGYNLENSSLFIRILISSFKTDL